MGKFLPLNSLYASTTLGFSMRQGPHQLAQKSMSRYLPLKELTETGLPFTSGRLSSGTVLPTQEAPDDCSACCWALLFFSISAKKGLLGYLVFRLCMAVSSSAGEKLREAQLSARNPSVELVVDCINPFR